MISFDKMTADEIILPMIALDSGEFDPLKKLRGKKSVGMYGTDSFHLFDTQLQVDMSLAVMRLERIC